MMEGPVKILVLLGSFLFSPELGRGDEQCSVIADCNGQVRWKHWPSKHPTTQEIEVVIESPEFTAQPNQGENEVVPGPSLHYYSNAFTWSMGRRFCNGRGKRLCKSTELCVYENDEREFLFDVIPGDNWVPVLDATNEWIEVGDSNRRTCYKHGPNYGPPPWGITPVSRPYKGHIFCCPGSDENEAGLSIKYQYIGQLATYASSLRQCEQRDMRLCSTVEVCRNFSPVFGVVSGDMWVAVNDRHNEWIEVGDSLDRTCWIHGVHYGPPPWGVRTDGSAVPHVGYVYCCD